MTPLPQPAPVRPGNLASVMHALADDIGPRLAGTPADRAAIRTVSAALRDAGAAVRTESFPMQARMVTSEQLEVCVKGRWRTFPCSLFSNTPGTRGRTVEAPLVFFESPAAYHQPDLSHLRDKAVVHLGCHIESREAYRRLIAAQPAFLLFVDVRYPGSLPLADGMFSAYTRAIGAVPTVNIAYQDAWSWKSQGATAARLRVKGGMRASVSANVIAELPGQDPSAGILAITAHHDTQAGCPGADDNASGVAGIVELARVLAPLERRRTIRLISFGAEEQLSVGSAAYVRQHRGEIERDFRMVFNLDGIGSVMGWTQLYVNGPSRLTSATRTGFSDLGLYPDIKETLVPYADHFPFVAAGTPGIWMYRPNCTTGRFFHHRADDDNRWMDPVVMAGHLDAVARLMADWSRRRTLPFPIRIPAAQRREAAIIWNDLFGGWDD